MEFVKGPDLPTGAIIQGKQGIIDAYKNGGIWDERNIYQNEKYYFELLNKVYSFEQKKQLAIYMLTAIRIKIFMPKMNILDPRNHNSGKLETDIPCRVKCGFL